MKRLNIQCKRPPGHATLKNQYLKLNNNQVL